MPTGVYKRPDPEARFRAKVQVDEATGCHVWTASLNKFGYGKFGRPGFHGQWMMAHRFAWQLAHGSLPEGLDLDHLCRNRACVNVTHLRAVDRQTNLLAPGSESNAKKNSDKTHCKRGHALTGDNLRPTNRGQRECKECYRMHARNRYNRKKAAA